MAEKHRRPAEDAVEYCLFPVIPGDKTGEDVNKLLEEKLRSYLTFLSPQLIDVIWQNEGFNLTVEDEQGSTPAHLRGITNVGDNIEDEWFIVYLLFQLTSNFQGLVVKVFDNDGEFLLIEAADSLPKWLNPDNAENRVYLFNGKVHIIPVPQSPSDLAAFPTTVTSVGDAVECVRTYKEQTKASMEIQKAVKNRVKSFPELMEQNLHYAHSYVPAALAAILNERPQLIAPAVQAFYYRDPIDLKCCRTFQFFRPGTRIIHRTKFTRCLYAQLVQQNFQADRRSGWVLPSSSNPKHKSHDLGMKLAHGFEILCAKSSKKPSQSSNGQTSIPTNDSRWLKYVKSLQDKQYFRGELEGSVLYKELLEGAWKFYEKNILQSDSTISDPGAEILQLLNTVKFDIEAMRMAESTLPPPDDDSWLNLTPESLDAIMKKRGGNRGMTDAVDGSRTSDPAFDLGQVADSMKRFVGKVSGIEGAEFPGEEEEDDDADIQFDGSGFITAMQEMFEFDDDDGTSSGSDMSEYGWDADSDNESGPRHHAPASKIKRPPSLDKYMDIMDKELSKTEVGKSFEKQPKPKPKETPKASNTKARTPSRDINDEDDDFMPVNVDLNIVKNMLESFGAQEGLAGPSSNILGSMGVAIPPNEDLLKDQTDSPAPKPHAAQKPQVPPRRPEQLPQARQQQTPSRPERPPRPKPGQTPQRPDPRTPNRPEPRTPNRPEPRTPNRPEAHTPNRPEAKTRHQSDSKETQV